MLRISLFLILLTAPLRAEVPRVVSDIAPVHGLVSMVMDGVGQPELVVRPGSSPHHHAMRPSEAQLLTQADLVVWVGPELTRWLEEPIATLAPEAEVLELMHVKGAHLLGFREGAMFEAHDHGHGHDEHEEHEGDDEHEGEDHEEHHSEEVDPHLWLSPENGSIFLIQISETLGRLDPENAAHYAQNAERASARLRATAEEIDAKLAAHRGKPFIVLHDGFHYFEEYFDIEAIGAISTGDAESPGAARMQTLRTALQDSGVRCAFTEPGVGTRLLETATEGLDVSVGTLDPLGSDTELGADHYPQLLRDLADNMAACLGA